MTYSTRRAAVRAPGTCGELVQGLLGGVLCHITCPVALYSTVAVELANVPGPIRGPKDHPKTLQAVAATLHELGARGLGATVAVDSELPVGKGMASSTADVAAAISATALALGTVLSPQEVARLAVQVEPTDGTMFPGIALFDHLHGSVCELLGPPPPADMLVLDFGGTVDTLGFNAVDRRPLLEALAPRVEEAARLVRRGIAQSDPSLIGQGASLSAQAHQAVLPKPQLPSVLEFAARVGAVGVNVAHSGTVIGVLLGGRHAHTLHHRSDDPVRLARAAFPNLTAACLTRLIGGGCQVVPQEAQAWKAASPS